MWVQIGTGILHRLPNRSAPCSEVQSSGDHSGSRGKALALRAYELMIIFKSDLEESEVQTTINRLEGLAKEVGGTLDKVDKRGVRRFAFEIKHMWEGFYVVLEFVSPNPLDEIDRTLRLADDVIRHKFMRLPVPEAHKRGLVGTTN